MSTERSAAFCPDEVHLRGAGNGPLGELRFAAKDLFDVAGHVTGCGNPDWRRTHAPAKATATAVQRLVDAGAELIGKTITDELAFSLAGQNLHYGTPPNPAAPGRIPGGSSSGSASAVAGGLVDFALGTDTGGSIRVPASLCGIYGLRPTHGAIPLDGVMPLAPSFDVVGWFARSADLLARVGDVLLPADASPRAPGALVVIEEAFALADESVRAALHDALARTADVFATTRSAEVASLVAPPIGGLEAWMERFRSLQGREIWATHGAWVEAVRPRFAPDVAERFAWSKSITESAAAAGEQLADAVRSRVDELLANGDVLCLPTTPCVAPPVDASADRFASYRTRVLSLTCIAGLAGAPEVTLPVARVAPAEGGAPCPVGLSLIARRRSDRSLLELAGRVAARLGLA